MEQLNPFPPTLRRHGAPLGRQGSNPANLEGVRRLHARHQGGGNGYDKGGAYWGTPSNVWGVWGHVGGETFCVYVRAASRTAAIEKVRQGEV